MMAAVIATAFAGKPPQPWLLERLAVYAAAAALAAQFFLAAAGWGRGGEWIAAALAGEALGALWLLRDARAGRQSLAKISASLRADVTAHKDLWLAGTGLGKRIDGRPVLDAVSLTLRSGELVGLLGPQGAGKTACLRCLAGDLRPDEGRVLLAGQDVTRLPMHRRALLGIAYVPQSVSVFRGLSVARNVRAVLEMVEPDRAKREKEIDALLADFALEQLRDAPATALSGGERRRLELARALATRPHFLLLDEPFARIDPIAVGDIRDLVLHIKKRGVGVLMTDHNVRESLQIIDRAYILVEGRVVLDGTPAYVLGEENSRLWDKVTRAAGAARTP
jgi:lipopolysaccharide export system ATP-binding protein